MAEMHVTKRAVSTQELSDDLGSILTRAIKRARMKIEPEMVVSSEVNRSGNLWEVERAIAAAGLDLETVLAEASLEAARGPASLEERVERDQIEYLIACRSESDLRFTPPEASVSWSLDPVIVLRAVRKTNIVTELLHDLSLANEIPIFDLLGMRNLSAFVGEIFKNELWKLSKDKFMPNPHQDGYPDLMALTPEGRLYIEKNSARMSEKSLWSPYPFGGVEVKATVGETPRASELPKPGIGESRWPILKGADWKAHHQETNYLIGIFWDFISTLPTVLAVFFRNDLTRADWRSVVKPKPGGGRTTSVSPMTRAGVKKMGKGWLVLPAENDILAALTKSSVYDISEADITSVARNDIR